MSSLSIYPLCLAGNNPPCPGTRKDQIVWAAISQSPVDVEVQTWCHFSQLWHPFQCHKEFCSSKHPGGQAGSSKHQLCLVTLPELGREVLVQSLVRAEAHWHSGQEGQEKPSTDPKGCPVLELLSSNPSLNPDSEELRALLILCSHICTAP